MFALSYAVNTVNIDRGTMLWVAIPSWADLADKIGRKPVFLIGTIALALLMFPYLWSIGQQNIPMIFLFAVLMSGIAYSASNGIWPSFFAEMFDTRVRLSGMAIGTQIGFALAGFAPTIAVALMTSGPNPWTCRRRPPACISGRHRPLETGY